MPVCEDTSVWYSPPAVNRGAVWRIGVTLVDDEVPMIPDEVDAGLMQESGVARIPTTILGLPLGAWDMAFTAVESMLLDPGTWDYDVYVTVGGARFKAMRGKITVRAGIAEAL